MLTSSEMTVYSRSIRILRIGLLLGAIGLLAAMVVIGVFRPGTGFAPGSFLSVSESGPDTNVSAPVDPSAPGGIHGPEAQEDVDCSVLLSSRYADVTTRGDAFSIFADVARLCGSGPDVFVAEDPTFEIRFHDSGGFLTTSRLAKLDFGEETAVLTGGVRIETAGGTIAETSEILVDFRERRGLSRSKVHARGPFGVIEAGMMEISLDILDDGKNPANGVDVDGTLTFAKGVMITFNPLDQRD